MLNRMFMSRHQSLGQNLNLGIYFRDLKYLGIISTIQNFILEEIMSRLRLEMLDTISLQNLPSCLLPRKRKKGRHF